MKPALTGDSPAKLRIPKNVKHPGGYAVAQAAPTNAPAAAVSLRRRMANAIDKFQYV